MEDARHARTRAMDRSAYAVAATHFAQALDAADHLPETRETLELTLDLSIARLAPTSPAGSSIKLPLSRVADESTCMT